jgi:aminoglycoside/choline kinase family phosphotransferase
MHPSSDQARERARLGWTQRVLGEPGVELVRASVDAGFRSYWRTTGSCDTRIVMDSPPDKEDVRPWLRMRGLLQDGGVRVPHVLAEDVPQGSCLLEDLGVDTYLQVIDDSNADTMFDAAMTQLLRLQAITPPSDLPPYDETLLVRELRLFDEWFVGRHLGITLDGAAMGNAGPRLPAAGRCGAFASRRCWCIATSCRAT